MFCPKCGAKVDNDSKFCTECGASLADTAKIVAEVREQKEPESEPDGESTDVGSASTPTCEPEAQAGDGSEVAAQPAPGSEVPQQVSTPKKKEPKALYVLGIAVGLVVIGVLSWQFFFNKSNGDTAAFGQKSVIVCTVETKITPTDKDGKKIKSYTVELVGDNGYTAKARVNGENGFPLSTFGDAKAGTYALKVTNKKSKVEYSVPVKIVKKSQTQDTAQTEVTIRVPSLKGDANDDKTSGDDEKADATQTAAYRAYNQKCQEFLSKYGKSTVIEPSNSNALGLTGLCVADLVDFDDDGVEELLTVTCGLDDNAFFTTWGTSAANTAYEVNVWAYEDGGLRQAYSGNWVDNSNGAGEFLSLVNRGDQVFIRQMTYGLSADMQAKIAGGQTIATESYSFIGKAKNHFKTMDRAEFAGVWDSGESKSYCTINGTDASEEDLMSLMSKYGDYRTYNLVDFSYEGSSYSESSSLGIKQVQKKTANTLAKLADA